MSSKCGIICEYNPFHNGHKYHLEKTKELTGCEVICVMSGDFTQRCQPAIFDKTLRAKAAIKSGAAAVVELPVLYSTATAEYFAYGAIKILSQIKGLDYISFGTETDDNDLLMKIVDVQLEESTRFKEKFAVLSKSGLSYPNCLAGATAADIASSSVSGPVEYLNNFNIYTDYACNIKSDFCVKNAIYSEYDILNTLSKPNNVLAIEYLKAIKKLNLSIKPIFIKRTDSGYNSDVLTPPYAAAGAIRKLINSGKSYDDFVPFDFGLTPLRYDIFESLAHLALLSKEIEYDEGLGIRLKKAAQKHSTLSEIIENVKTKRYTFSRINRAILGTMSDINKGFLQCKSDFFFKLLGVAEYFKGSIKDFGDNLITRFDKLFLKENSFASSVFAIDKKSSDIYSLITLQPSSRFYNKLLVL